MRKTQYTPATQGSDLVAFVRNETERINNAMESAWTHEVLEKLTREPSRSRPGQMVYADGTDWNPGSGEGIYLKASTGWTKLG